MHNSSSSNISIGSVNKYFYKQKFAPSKFIIILNVSSNLDAAEL